jgi:hypothetical protein
MWVRKWLVQKRVRTQVMERKEVVEEVGEGCILTKKIYNISLCSDSTREIGI